MCRVISKFADNAKNAIEQKDVKLTGIDGSKKIAQAGGVGGRWQLSFSFLICPLRTGKFCAAHLGALTGKEAM